MPTTSVGTIPEGLVSPYVTFRFGGPRSVRRLCRPYDTGALWTETAQTHRRSLF